MFAWLKNKFNYWLSERLSRTFQGLHTQRLKEVTKNLPQELFEINNVLSVLNNNNWAVYHLFKKTRNSKQYANAFLYFFYFFELNLKHLIISEMHTRNVSAMLLSGENNSNFFQVYEKEKLLKILDLGPTGKVIDKYLVIFPQTNIKNDLRKINSERTYIIHNMLKKEMSEDDVKQCFEGFFQKCKVEIGNTMKELDDILAKRPQKILDNIPENLKSNGLKNENS